MGKPPSSSKKKLGGQLCKERKAEGKSLKMIEEDLEDTYVDLLADDEKNVLYEKVLANLSQPKSKEKSPIKDDIITIFLDMCLNLGACLVIIIPLILLQNVLAIPQLVNLAVVIAIVLMFFIGVWTETRKGVWIRARKGIIYAVLGIVITVLTYILGG